MVGKVENMMIERTGICGDKLLDIFTDSRINYRVTLIPKEKYNFLV